MARYQAFYCEENAWWLCREGPRPCDGVLFVSNMDRRVALFRQKRGHPVVWDYHVVALHAQGAVQVHDFDSELTEDLAVGVPISRYLDETFPALREDCAAYLPLFRWVSRDVFLTSFGSDRRHMKTAEGRHLQPPPPWSSPTEIGGVAHNLDSFVDMRNTKFGEVMTLSDLRLWVARMATN